MNNKLRDELRKKFVEKWWDLAWTLHISKSIDYKIIGLWCIWCGHEYTRSKWCDWCGKRI